MGRTIEIKVNLTEALGRFKDLRGVNCGPLSPSGWDKKITLNLTKRYLELGIRVIRFHDFYPFDELDHIFPDPNADPSRPESYDFDELDGYIETAFKVADTVIFRIGYDWNDPPKNSSHLPLDKLAEVVKRIVLHYTRGWADGYHYDNILWEIWNEPDTGRFWAGTPEEYFELYGILAKAIKEVNPNAKVGGPTIAYDIGFLNGFLDYVKSHDLPLDFVSWHIYAIDPHKVVEKAKEVHSVMERHGFGDVPSVLDEWNHWVEKGPWDVFRDTKVASFQAAVLILLQDAPVDIATLYRGDAWNWGGLFYATGTPGKPFYVWLAYKQLLNTTRLSVSVHKDYLIAAAGLSPDGRILLLVSNFADSEVKYTVSVGGYGISQILAVDDHHDLEPLPDGGSPYVSASPYAVHLVILEKKGG